MVERVKNGSNMMMLGLNADIVRSACVVVDMSCLSLPRRRDTTKDPSMMFTVEFAFQSFIYALLLVATQLIDRVHRYH